MRFSSRVLVLALCAANVLGLCQEQLAPQYFLPSSVEEAPAIGDFPKDLLGNFAGLWSKDNLVPLLVGAGAVTAGIPADHHVKQKFFDPVATDGFAATGKQLGKSQLLGPVIGVSFLASRLTDNAKFQRVTYDAAQGFLVSNTVTAGLKKVSGRTRPDGANNYSFPSGHTANSFILATIVSRHYGWRKALPAYAAASYVGASRIRSQKHHLTDVLAGATIGYIVGRTVTRRSPEDGPPRFNLGVAVPPGGGAALNVGIRLW
ncbi:MAG: phosphatase PAP2 family protein [Acidobacteria bacterium]|nr:phosphatase PAP2 family protein [Acidobacteriota bacterium]